MFVVNGSQALYVIPSSLNPYSPMMEIFCKILLSEEVFNKMNIFGFTFEKNKIWSKNLKIFFRQFKLTLEGGYKLLFFFLKKKCLGSNKNVNAALFCLVLQRKPYLWHWKMYFTLILKLCFDYPTEAKQENY